MNIFQKIYIFFISLFKSKDQDEQKPDPNDTSDGEINDSITSLPVSNDDPADENENNTETMPDYSKLMVHLDNGHGKATPGKRSPSAVTGKGYGNYTKDQLTIYEYEYNRLIVKRVDEMLRHLGFKTFIVTPEVEGDVGLSVRANRSNNMARQHPECKHIFISAHLNAIGDGKTWYTGNNGSYWSAWTSKGKTQGDALAECFYDAAQEILPKFNKKIKTDMSDGDRDCEDNFTVLTKTNSPAVLVESFFMTNVDDVLFLKSDAGLNAVCYVYVKGIQMYYEKYVR